MKKINRAVLIPLLIAVALIGGYFVMRAVVPVDVDSLPISELLVFYSFDKDNINMMVGNSDYVFVGRVLENTGTQYGNYGYIEGRRVGGMPYTYYNVQVLENIKGRLRTAEPVEVQKRGGLAESKKVVSLEEGDRLPREGGIYVFVAHAQEDGSLVLNGRQSNIPVELSEGQNILDTPQYREYAEAYENEVLPSINGGTPRNRERFESIYAE